MILSVLPICANAAITTEQKEIMQQDTEFLRAMKIIDSTDIIFKENVLNNYCTLYNVNTLLNILCGTPNAVVDTSLKNRFINQGDLLSVFMYQLYEINAEDDVFAHAKRLGLLTNIDGFEQPTDLAKNFNLMRVLVNFSKYMPKTGEGVFQRMLEAGKLNDVDISTFATKEMADFYNYGTKKLPYKVINDGITGRTYYYVDYYGNMYNQSTGYNDVSGRVANNKNGKETLLRAYMSQQNMTSDGRSIIFTRCPLGQMYLYNFDTQIVKYIDTVSVSNSGGSYSYVTPEDVVYYVKSVYGTKCLYRVDLKKEPFKSEFLYQFPEKISPYNVHVTNDGKFASFEMSDSTMVYQRPAGTKAIVRLDIENKKMEWTYHSFDISNIVDHMQVNPVYPDLIFYAHETDRKIVVNPEGKTDDERYFHYVNIMDRANIMNFKTNQKNKIIQGTDEEHIYNNGLPRNILFFTHESWSENGEYLYITNLGTKAQYAVPGGMIRVNKDGSHRKYIYNPKVSRVPQENTGKVLGSSHGGASGDDRYCSLDSNYISIINQETNQVFPIAYPTNSKTEEVYKNHPYHAHSIMSPKSSCTLNWGRYDEALDTLGIAWFDYNSIDKNDIAEGGETKYNEYVSRLSYEGLDCESEILDYNQKNSIRANVKSSIYLNLDTSISDSVSDIVKVSFEYFDNGTDDLSFVYTRGAETENELCLIENGKCVIKRTGTNTWKTFEKEICANLQSPGIYGTDFKLSGVNSEIYISNFKVENGKDVEVTNLTKRWVGSSIAVRGTVKNLKKNELIASVIVRNSNGVQTSSTTKILKFDTDTLDFEIMLTKENNLNAEMELVMFKKINLKPILTDKTIIPKN